jgi:transposase
VIGSTRQLRVFAFGQAVDMRNGFDGLFALVANQLRHDVLAGDLFLFVSKTRKRAKVLDFIRDLYAIEAPLSDRPSGR